MGRKQMPLSRSAVQELYTKKVDHYSSFIAAFQASDGLKALLRHSPLVRGGMRVLDAGCGFGTATFALLQVLRENNLDYEAIDAFDLTPVMLARFRREMEARGMPGVGLQQADVLALETLPASWTNYDLIISASMLEYLAKPELPRALAGLRARLVTGGHLLAMITRKTPETKVFIEWWWHAARYTREELRQAFTEAGFHDPVFRPFPGRYFWLNRA